MAHDIARRLIALETRSGVGNTIAVILRTFVQPSNNGPVAVEPRAYVDAFGKWRMDRERGETAEAFTQRATRDVPRVARQVARLQALQ